VEGFGEDAAVSLFGVPLSLFAVLLSLFGVLLPSAGCELVSDVAPSVFLSVELVDEESDFPFWA
jgi:hypothetical protein